MPSQLRTPSLAAARIHALDRDLFHPAGTLSPLEVDPDHLVIGRWGREDDVKVGNVA